MTHQVGTREQVEVSTPPRSVSVEWAGLINEEGGPMRWLGSWLVGGDTVEGSLFYAGHGSERTEHSVPPGAYGVRVRRWLSEGMDPEYVDVTLDGEASVRTGELDFDSPQSHRVFRPGSGREILYTTGEE
jgi:hypothetical protein